MAFVTSCSPSLSRTNVRSTSFTTSIHPPTISTPHAPLTLNPSSSLSPPRMLFDVSLFQEAETVALPQHDTANAAERRREIEENKEQYQWGFDVIGKAPMIKGIPSEEYPAPGWVHGIAKVFIRIKSNDLAVRFGDATDDFNSEKLKLLSAVGQFVGSALQKIAFRTFTPEAVDELLEGINNLFDFKPTGKGCSFKEYKDLFKVFKPDKVVKFDQFLDDDIFGWYRIAGPSPMHLRKMLNPVKDVFPELTDDILRGIEWFKNDSISACESEGRLFCVDYKEFDGVTAGKLPDGTPKQDFHIYAPTALFAVPKDVHDRNFLIPIAIRCGQGQEYPMYTPNESHSDKIAWIAAKTTVQVADGVMHETRYHLGRTHLLLEIFICAMNRSLAPSHPLSKFLKIHFEGTAWINFLGSKRLAAPGGTIDVITAPQIELSTELCRTAIDPPFRFEDLSPDREFAARGVLDADHLHYPYRDDALRLWTAILQWVGAYVKAYYKSDSDVAADYELAEWCREIRSPDGGRFSGFGETDAGEIKTVDYLVRAIATLVFIGSVQHAALNFAQGAFMQFVPAMPLTGLTPPPTTHKPFKSMRNYVEEMLPDLETAQRQLDTAELLAGFQWTTLGEYGRDLSYAPDEVDEAVEEFRENLSEIGAEIQKRNRKERKAGLPTYNFLVPKNIPQSTNV